ncbi:MAG: TRAP transporter small permease subunit [Erythrobacter sp.]|nr:MAG: TRAP transporter small permease subunit [Erythrobacter sp.]
MLKNTVIWIGGLALLAATLVDTLAVIGRNVGLPVPGSIELMQAIVLVSAAIGIVIATWEDSHARVRLVVERLGAGGRRLADLASDLLSLLFVIALLAGSVWLAIDLWYGHEQSEIVGIPWAVLRIIANVCLAGCAALLVWHMLRRRT